MKITPTAGPLPIQPSIDKPASAEAKAKVVAMLTGQQPQQVANQTQGQAEEMVIPKPQMHQSDNTQEVTEATEEVTAPVVDPQLSAKFAQLARQEKSLRAQAQKQQQAIQQREEALKAREAALGTKDQEYQTGYINKARIKSDPLSVLAEAGVSYEQLTEQIINQRPADPRLDATIAELKAEIQSLRAANEEVKTNMTAREKANYDAALNQIKMDAVNLIKNDPEFETIKATKSTNDVVDLIVKTFEKDGVLLTVEEAAKEVEDYLIEEAMNLTRIQKIQKRLQSASTATAPQPKQGAPKPQQQQGMKTLTNAASSTRQLTARERAIAAAEGRLNS